MKNIWNELKNKHHKRYLGGLDIFKYIGPGLLVTVGFIDPGNWASNFAAGSEFGYALLWVVTLSTIMLIILQHNVAHLGIVYFFYDETKLHIKMLSRTQRFIKRFYLSINLFYT